MNQASIDSTSGIQPERQSRVLYRKSAWRLKGKPALLQWVGSRIQLLTINPNGGLPERIIFDYDVKEISGLETANQLMALTMGDKEYHLNFSPAAGAMAAFATVLPLKQATSQLSPMQEVGWWRQNLQAHGVKSKLSKASKTVIFCFAIFAAVVLLTQLR